jgi:UDP:flavonoid glycosyltransferase YjiC (YdhE family)
MTDRYQADVPARRIAFFISPHGFGHAARAAGVMEALAEIESSLQFDIFTTVPEWFFASSNSFGYQYHRLETDIGLIQKTPFQEDLPATVQKLKNFLPFNQSRIATVAEKIRHLKCQLVVCDIASRKIKSPAAHIRERLGLSDSCKVVMITAGGVPKNYGFIEKLKNQTDTHFIIPGASDSEKIQNNLILLPENSAHFHPDLINAADAVIGKVGYSTIAEIYQAGVPFGYSARTHYRESKPLVDFVKNHMSGLPIAESEFQNGRFTGRIKEILQMPRAQGNRPNGADQIADFMASRL